MLVALYNRTFEADDIPMLQRIIHKLEGYNLQLIFFQDFYERIKTHLTLERPPQILFTGRQDLPLHTDMLFSFGGDGTMLDTVTFVGNSNIPIIGINLGEIRLFGCHFRRRN